MGGAFMLSTNNLFRYATSELSQDAFISWLLSHALKENKNINPLLTECALEFLHKIKGLEKVTCINNLLRQVDNIDVLVQGDGFEIIIEDKTYTNTHNNQISNYLEARVNKVSDKTEVFCVLYKIIEQPHPEKGVDFEFTRNILLDIFRKYRVKSDNVIFNDYVDFLEDIEARTQSYKKLPIHKWNDDAYRGFFVYLAKNLNLSPFWWGYVANPSGGFQCYSWNFITSDELDKIGITDEYLDEIYLQIENDIIAVKMTPGKDRDKVNDIRHKLYCYFKDNISDFEKKSFRYGKYMTIGFVKYNEMNYKEKIDDIQKAANNLKKTKILS